LIDILTRGIWAPANKASAAQKRDPEYVHRVRDAEDLAFAERCGLKRIDLRIDEPALHDRRHSSLSALDDDVDAIEAPLARALGEIAAGWTEETRGTLFAPLGIGHHVNHRAVAQVALDHRETLSARFDLYLYEDIPYAYNPFKRQAGILRAREELGEAMRARHVLPVDWAAKKSLIGLYESQFRSAPLWVKFRPASFAALGLHEAFWPVQL